MELFFRKEGTGKPLIIIHGLYGSSDNWFSISKKLAPFYTVYSIDQRNHGRSPHHPDNSYPSMADDLLEFFERHKIDSATLLGHSMGGKTAMLFAAHHPEKTDKLIVADIAPKNYSKTPAQNQYNVHLHTLSAMQSLDLSPIKNRKLLEEKLTAKLNDKNLSRFILKNTTFDNVNNRLKWKLNVNALIENIESIVSDVDFSDLKPFAPISRFPVVFIRGKNSPYIGDDDIAEILKIYPHARIIDIPGAGHWLHAEQPDLFVGAVLAE